MSEQEQNLAKLKEAYVRWADSKGTSADQRMAICAENINFGSIAEGGHGVSYLTTYRSRGELAQYFASLASEWEMIEYVPEHFVAADDRVVMLGRCSWRFKRTGKVVATPKVDSWRFADGKAVEFYEYYDTAKVRDAVS